jgi:hypothetical protein
MLQTIVQSHEALDNFLSLFCGAFRNLISSRKLDTINGGRIHFF